MHKKKKNKKKKRVGNPIFCQVTCTQLIVVQTRQITFVNFAGSVTAKAQTYLSYSAIY